MIRNTDGTPYQLSGALQAYNPCNDVELDLFNSLDEEAIRISGTPIYYYEILIDANVIDPVYNEARGAIFATDPVLFYGMYDPISSQNYHNVFGIDSPDEISIELNYRAVLNAVGHPPRIGSRLFTPHKAENWVIRKRVVADFRMWREIRLILECSRFQESLTRGEGKVTQSVPPYTVN